MTTLRFVSEKLETKLRVLLLGALVLLACARGDESDLAQDNPPSEPIDGSPPYMPPGSSGSAPVRAPDATGGEMTSPSSDLADSGGDAQDAGLEPADTGAPTAAHPAPGEILISEIMYDPSGSEPANEWFEVTNVAAGPRSLNALVLQDGAGRLHTISAAVVINAGEFVILARTRAGAISTNIPASAIAYEYGAGSSSSAGILLANGSNGGLALRDGSTMIATAPYGGWFSTSKGQSIQLKNLTPASSATKLGWCLSKNVWSNGADLGTPGAAPDCP